MTVIFVQNSDLKNTVEDILNKIKDKEKLSLKTSGTTGIPKTIIQDITKALDKKRGGLEGDLWLLTYSPERWAGISVLLHCYKFNSTVVIPKDLSFDSLVEAAYIYKITHISLTPSMFRNILLLNAELLRQVPLKQITFGGEYTTQEIIDTAKRLWSTARVTHTYASTEVGDICSVSDGLEGIPNYKFSKYSFSENDELIIDGYNTCDIWKLREGRYYFFGRVQEIINVGGNKVSPIFVETKAIECGVKIARAYSIESPILGSVVGLDYVGDIEQKQLLSLLRKNLPKYACPCQINKVEQLELSKAGKMKRL